MNIITDKDYSKIEANRTIIKVFLDTFLFLIIKDFRKLKFFIAPIFFILSLKLSYLPLLLINTRADSIRITPTALLFKAFSV